MEQDISPLILFLSADNRKRFREMWGKHDETFYGEWFVRMWHREFEGYRFMIETHKEGSGYYLESEESIGSFYGNEKAGKIAHRFLMEVLKGIQKHTDKEELEKLDKLAKTIKRPEYNFTAKDGCKRWKNLNSCRKEKQ